MFYEFDYNMIIIVHFSKHSVVTSISVLTQDDPESMRKQHERDYEKYAVESMNATVTQPKFKFYLYNEEGDLVQEELSIHDIQHFLLHTANSKNVQNQNNFLNNWKVKMDGEGDEDSKYEGKLSFTKKYIFWHIFISF